MTSPQTQPEQPPTQEQRAQTATAPAQGQTTVAPTPAQAQQPPEAPAERREEQARGLEPPAVGKVVHLHTAHPRVPIPYVTPGDLFSGARKGAGLLPSPRKMVYYGILGGMTVAGALQWPVAVAIGAATEVVTREQAARQRAEQQQEEQRRRPETEPSARTETTQPTQPTQPAQTATA
ncbi:hypothetical protein CLM62_43410 [Streptomyces sp. SA15]|uniref:hypothetical protein n=1 Tax=Streptomyces sp. SA15 TaxID=934019 RepID=UPI000BAFCBB9|nr:hypothetical protein [Streptomyces sp. SA15]PAZ10014.1 hypothetical protein CLM62_43410 [Streptomyces sp. SA15]